MRGSRCCSSRRPGLCARLAVAMVVLACCGACADTGGWDHDASYELLGYAQAAYCMEGFDDWDCGSACSRVTPLRDVRVLTANSTKGLAFVGWHAGDGDSEPAVIVISFRGTLSRYFENWWSDLSSLKLSATPYCPVDQCRVSVLPPCIQRTHFCGLNGRYPRDQQDGNSGAGRIPSSKNHWPLAWRRPGVGLCCTSLPERGASGLSRDVREPANW